MALLKRNCGSVYYDVLGPDDAPPLVMVRGLGRCVRHWLGFEQQLAKRYRVITVELRGVGARTARMTPVASLFDLASDIVAVLDELRIEKAHMLGISLGGMVALACGIEHHERFRSLIVINTSIAGLRTRRITVGAVRAMATGLINKSDKTRLHRELVDVLVGTDCPPARKKFLADAYLKIAGEDGLYADTVVMQLLAAARFLVKKQLPRVALPVLVVYGTADRFVPNVNSKRIAALLPHATLRAVVGGGHELPLDKPDELQSLIDEWMTKHEATVNRRA